MRRPIPRRWLEGTSSQIALVGHLVRRNWALLVAGAALELGFLVLLLVTVENNWNLLPRMFFGLFAAYVAILILARRRLSDGSATILIVVLFAIAFRLTVLFSGPVLSFDMFRYYWDGKVAASGINPYLYPPEAPELSTLRDPVWELINHKELRTGYPPLMELFFQFLYVAFRSPLAYKVSFFLFDLATIAIILLILKQAKLDQRNVMVYAWAPLSVIEISQSGHNDSMAVFLVLLSFLLLLRGRNHLSATAMGLSVVSKLYPIFFAPLLFKRWGIRGTLAFFATIVAFHAFYADIGLEVFRGLLFAVNETFFNGSVFPAMTALLDWPKLFADPDFAAQLIVYVIYGAFLIRGFVLVLRTPRDALELMKMSFLLLGAVLLLNRTFFAWYMTWIIPFLVFYKCRSWLYLSGAIFLGYMKYDVFPPPPYEAVDPNTRLVIDLVQYLPFYVLLTYELLKKRIVLRVSTDQQSLEIHSRAA